MIILLGNEINNCDELIKTVLKDITIDDVADEYGVLKSIDQDWIHDRYCDYFDDEEEYNEFNRILYSEDHGDIDLDIGDSMYHMSGGGFSSWSDYYRYRFG